MEIKTSYFSIPDSVFNREDLTLIESCLYGLILSIEQSGNKEVWASNDYFAKKLKTSVRTIIRALNKIETLGLIEKNIRQQGKLKQRMIKTVSASLVLENKQSDKMSLPHDKMSLPPCQIVTTPMTNCHYPHDKMSHQYKYNINNNINTNSIPSPEAQEVIVSKNEPRFVKLLGGEISKVVKLSLKQEDAIFDKILQHELYPHLNGLDALYFLFSEMESYFLANPKKAKTANFNLVAHNWINRAVGKIKPKGIKQ